jgi:uncharacterized protein
MNPWYKEPWPWILMSGPATVVVAGLATTWIAYATSDGLVADDYYKRGLAVNAVLGREQAAERLGISARFERAGGKMRVHLNGAAPEVLFLQFAHATRAGHDLRLRLAPAGGGLYEAALPPLAAGHWHLILEDPRGEWRVTSEDLQVTLREAP